MSHRLLCRMKHDQRIRVNGNAQRTNYVLSKGDIIELYVDIDRIKKGIEPENLNLEIIFEDESLLVINKRTGMVVHPVSNHQSGTVSNGVAHLLLERGLPAVVRPLGRLDRDTTGVIMFAKNSYIQESLIRQMKFDGFEKHYLAIIHGNFPQKKDTICLPIARKPGSIMHREVNVDGQAATTHLELIDSNKNASILKVKIETGRTHQIRVHLNHLGFPIIGDDLYNPHSINDFGIKRQALHSQHLEIIHPITGKNINFDAPCPEDMKKLISVLQLNF